MKIDRKNEDPAYWEKVLRKHALENREEIEEETVSLIDIVREEQVNGKKDSSTPDMKRLRRKFDGNDPFMNRPNVLKVRTREREIPEWSASEEKVRELLLKVFPRMQMYKVQKDRAARWLRIIQMYYRMQMPLNHVAAEMRMTTESLRPILYRIRKAAHDHFQTPSVNEEEGFEGQS